MAPADQVVPAHLILIRHGESNVTVSRTIGGFRSCTGLSDLGQRQAVRLRERLAQTHELADAVLISSDFRRAMETAELISPAVGGGETVIDADFGEHDPGPEIDGMTFAQYIDRFGTPDWNDDPHQEVFPGGETVAEFRERIGSALERTIREYSGERVIVCCHGGVIDVVFRQLLRTPLSGSFELHTLNTSITEFRSGRDGMWRLARYNDAAHLSGLPAETPRVDAAR